MYQLVVLVLDELEKCPEVLDAWEAAGVSGVTILESSGLGRMRALFDRDDIPLMPSLSSMLARREEQHRTLFALAQSDAMVERLIEAAQRVTDGLHGPNKGILFVVPVTRAVGLGEDRL